MDSVRDGCTLRLLLLPTKHDVLLHVSGVQTPQFNIVNKPDGVSSGNHDSVLSFRWVLLSADVCLAKRGCT